MSQIKTSVIPAGLRNSSRVESWNHVKQQPICKTGLLESGCLSDTNNLVLTQFYEKFNDPGVMGNPDEREELGIFQRFISSHVKTNKIRDVPCMLLWAEWVRFSLKQTRKFPQFILETEFRDLIINRFRFDVMEDEYGGLIYPGIQFVSEINWSVDLYDRSSAGNKMHFKIQRAGNYTRP
jgi:hypothetical protein